MFGLDRCYSHLHCRFWHRYRITWCCTSIFVPGGTFTSISTLVPGSSSAGGVAVTVPLFGSTVRVRPLGTPACGTVTALPPCTKVEEPPRTKFAVPPARVPEDWEIEVTPSQAQWNTPRYKNVYN
ncbi:hypothetical protein A1140_10670 [Staphylococcus felis]